MSQNVKVANAYNKRFLLCEFNVRYFGPVGKYNSNTVPFQI